MIIQKTMDEVEYPINGNFRVGGYLKEKQQKQINILNSHIYLIFNLLMLLESVCLAGLTLYLHMMPKTDLKLPIVYFSFLIASLLLSIVCGCTIVLNTNRLLQQNQSITCGISNCYQVIFKALTLQVPIAILKNARILGNFSLTVRLGTACKTVFINYHKKYLICNQLLVIAKIYGFLLLNWLNNLNPTSDVDIFQWIYFTILVALNLFIIQVVLQLQSIVPYYQSSKKVSKSSSKEEQNEINRRNSCCLEVNTNYEKARKNKQIRKSLCHEIDQPIQNFLETKIVPQSVYQSPVEEVNQKYNLISGNESQQQYFTNAFSICKISPNLNQQEYQENIKNLIPFGILNKEESESNNHQPKISYQSTNRQEIKDIHQTTASIFQQENKNQIKIFPISNGNQNKEMEGSLNLQKLSSRSKQIYPLALEQTESLKEKISQRSQDIQQCQNLKEVIIENQQRARSSTLPTRLIHSQKDSNNFLYEPSYKLNSLLFWYLITFFESFVQLSQALIFFLLCVSNPILATIAIAAWSIYSFLFCYQNIFEIIQAKSGEINIARSIFFGYKVDYLVGLYFKQFNQLKIYDKMHKMIFVALYKAIITVISLIYFHKSKSTINCVNLSAILIDFIIILIKVPAYYRVFIKSKSCSFSLLIRPDSLSSCDMQKVNIFNKFLNIIIYSPIKEFSPENTILIDNLLAQRDKMIYFEIYNQVRIYNKFGHCEVQIIRFDESLYRWIQEKLTSISKSIRVIAFSVYNDKKTLLKLTKDQLLSISFHPALKYDFTSEEIIASLPRNYFPRQELKVAALYYSKEKIFSQILVFYRTIAPLLLNNPEMVLYSLVEV